MNIESTVVLSREDIVNRLAGKFLDASPSEKRGIEISATALGISTNELAHASREARHRRNISDLIQMRMHVNEMTDKFDVAVTHMTLGEQDLLKADVEGMVGALQILLSAWGQP